MSGGLLQISEPGQSGIKASCVARTAGIDLGTTYSLVATVRGGQPMCLADEEGRVLTPSVVQYRTDGAVSVGWKAREQAHETPLDTIASAKRFMGRGLTDADSKRHMGYRFGASREGLVTFAVAGRTVTPIEVSAEILRNLRSRAEQALGGALEGVVITVPAYFDDAQRQATKDAGRLAGLNVLRLLNEPTAAALAYGLDKQRSGLFAVFDLGGGTFDISILKLEGGVFEVKSTCGDTALGGDDIDHAVAMRMLGGVSNEPATWRQALAHARVAKEALTEHEHWACGSKTLSRGELEQLARPVVERTRAPCLRALKDAGLLPEQLDGVVLVGGQTRMPLVRQCVRELFGREPLGDMDPDHVVALGAAVQADLLAGSGPRDDVLLLDVIPLSLGIETMGGVVEKILPRNSTIPAAAKQVFTTYADRQTGLDIHVLQGEREVVDQCRSLARFTLRGIPPMPAGIARVEITFQVDADGLLTVSAREQRTGIEQRCDVKPTYGLTDEEVERMLLDSYEHAESDFQERQLREERVEAEQMLTQTARALALDSALLEETERREIVDALEALRQAAQGTDHLAIRRCREALDHRCAPFAQRRMDQVVKQALAGRTLDEAAR